MVRAQLRDPLSAQARQRSRSVLRAVDFFCGAGGMTHGLLKAGFDVLGGIDNHLPCKETYEHPSNNVRPGGETVRFIHADISDYSPNDLERDFEIERDDDALLFAGCNPCQYWSKVNTSRQRSVAGGQLLEDFRRFVAEFRPGYVVVENVPGLRRNAEISGLETFLGFLEQAGYSYDHKVVAAYLYGIPQKRTRYLLIATRVSKREMKPGIRLPEPVTTNGTPFPEDMKLKYHIGVPRGFRPLAAGVRSDDPPLHWAAGLSPQNLQRIRNTPKDGGSRDAWRDDDALQIDAYRGKDECFRDVYGRMRWDEPASTITTRFNSVSNGRFGHPVEDRAISLREGATLQTFPMTYSFPTILAEAARQIGNAVPPELARRVGCGIIDHYRSIRDEESRG